jgi:hypothetical protein
MLLACRALSGFWKNKPNGMTFAEYTGVLLRDVYLDAVEEEENK